MANLTIEDAQKQRDFRRTEDFVSEYANNFQFEQSAFDLKIIFGQLDQSEGKPLVDQHLSVTMSWASAKLLWYYLQVNIAAYELQHGKIAIPQEVLPAAVPIPKEQADDPTVRRLHEMIETLRKGFVSNL